MFDYEELNNALFEVLFTNENANKPVYIEITDDVFDKLKKRLNVEANDLDVQILESVKELLNLKGSNKDLFSRFELKHIIWLDRLKKLRKGDPETNYPNLPLLVTFTITASEMGTTGGFKTNAYYPRLKELIEVEDKKMVEESYRKIASQFWGDFNSWLDNYWQGQRGIGTAYSISNNRHIGFALSQALIRSVDRNKLPRLFRENSFSAYTSLVAKDMEKIVDDWIKKEELEFHFGARSPSKPFKDLWSKPEARMRIASIICRELELWDGKVSVSKSESELLDKTDYALRLELLLNTFPSKSINLVFAISSPTEIEDNKIKILNTSDEKPFLELSNSQSDGWLRPVSNIFPISNEDLISSNLQIDIGKDFIIERYPKNLIVFKFDDLSRKYFETERLELGIKCVILAFQSENFTEKIEDVINNAARNGWNKYSEAQIRGLPKNWIMFTDVELLQSPNPELIQHTSLEALKPTFSGSLNFSQGLQLPGRPPKWHIDVPIEIKASILGAESIQLRIVQFISGQETEIAKKKFNGQTAIWKLDNVNFKDGDYFIQLFKDDEDEEVTEKLLRLRSSNSIDENSWLQREKLVHDLSLLNSAVMQTCELNDSSKFYVDGAHIFFDSDTKIQDEHKDFDISSWWNKKDKVNPDNLINTLKLKKVEIKGCFINGSHNYELPIAGASKSRSNIQKSATNFVDGVCKFCGIKKKFAATPWAAERRKNTNKNTTKKNLNDVIIPKVNISDFANVENSIISWDVLLDSIFHLGGGTFGALESIANNIDTSALFKYEFINHLDQLALIDLHFDDYYEIKSWEVSPKCLVEVNENFILTGLWSKNDMNKVDAILGKNSLFEEKINQSFSKKYIKNLNQNDHEKLKVLDYRIVKNPTLNMLKILPTINNVVTDLPSKPYLGFEKAEKYIPEINSWIETNDIHDIGGYRLTKEYRRKYIVRNQSDIENRTIRYCNPELAKHYASAITNKALFFYLREKKQLITPLGARLPGLYGRALVLASGQMPVSDESKRYIIYENITGEHAKLLSYKVGQPK